MNTQTRIAMLLCAVMLLVPALTLAQTPQAANSLRIVVIAGEDAINIIQQKTAVNPIVEVRDRNNLPVAGVAVTFSVSGQGASFAGGASTLTVTTNAAGQAVVTGLTPTTPGAVTINASAVVNGETIGATIKQNNFATAAEAAAAAASAVAASGGRGSGTGGGTRGGMSGRTLGIIGGVAAAGALAATQAGGGGDTDPVIIVPPLPPVIIVPPPPPPTTVFNGTYSGTVTGRTIDNNCSFTASVTGGTMRLTLTTQPNGTVSGNTDSTSRYTVTSANCPTPGFAAALPPGFIGSSSAVPFIGPVTGTTSNIQVTQDQTVTTTIPNPLGGTITVTSRVTNTFTGSLNAGVITGSITYLQSDPAGSSTGTFPITLR